MSIVAGCYVVHIRCDHPKHDRAWMGAARKAGWATVRMYTDFCPICMDKYQSPPKTSPEEPKA